MVSTRRSRAAESLLRHHFASTTPAASFSQPAPTAPSRSPSPSTASCAAGGKLGLDLSHKAASSATRSTFLLRPPPPPPPPSQKDHFALPQPPIPTLPSPPLPFPHLHPVCGFASSSPYSHLPHHHESHFATHLHSRATPAPQQQQQQQEARGGALIILLRRRLLRRKWNEVLTTSIMGELKIVKQLWAYIRKNNLQDPNNKRKIICNDELRLVFETDCTDIKHIIPLEPAKEPVPHSKKLKSTAAEIVSSVEPRSDGYTVIISDALAKFFGTRERQMLQSEASRRIWDYIKRNQLEDPTNAKVILCDSRLQQLFGCEMLSALGRILFRIKQGVRTSNFSGILLV
ncbi:Upstream activation factor subunit spp27 [Ananas comosus]|uniref:Upstream activation factor subunit spp27 n=1 Tax=Ananas comosus TaxID=4615 RepID=A0A199UQC3_ANACO|nr:Upstream activation factor subunit spp27 [Ananas comosus]